MIKKNQVPAQQITGEYRLQGNHEMVAAFNFNADSSFEFYFIYGAVDRMAQGKYSVINNSIYLSSRKTPGKDFKIIKNIVQGDGTTIKVTDRNKLLQSNVVCMFMKGGEQDVVTTNNDGVAHSSMVDCDTLRVVHGFFPDAMTTIKSGGSDKSNYFELSLNPSLAELSFQGFVLKIEGDKLTGSLPYLFEQANSIFLKR
jgi:hypothetical protein